MAIFYLAGWSWVVFCTASQMDLSKVMQRGLDYERKGQCAHAVREFKKIIRVRPQTYTVYNKLAACFQTLGYPDIAEKYFRKTLEYDPQNSYSRAKLKEILKSREVVEVLNEDQDLEEQPTYEQIPGFRLYFVRDKKIYSISGDGSDLRPYTEAPLDMIYPDPSDRKGMFVVQTQEQGNQTLFYLEVGRGEIIPVHESQGVIDNPILSFNQKEIFFLEKLQGQTLLKSIPFKLNEALKASIQLKDLIEIRTFIKDDNHRLILSGRKELFDPLKIYLWQPGEQAEKLTFSTGDDLKPRLSADGNWLAYVREVNEKQELMVKNMRNFDEFPLTHLDGKELNFCFARLSSTIFFSSSRSDEKGLIVSFLGWVDPGERSIHKLQERSFHYRSLMTSVDDSYLYFLSDYDNNLEIYRMNLEKAREERLTISDADETQFGLWVW